MPETPSKYPDAHDGYGPQDLRIAEIRIHRRELPVVNQAYRMGHGGIELVDSTIVELLTEDGLVGYGETCPVGPTYQPHHARGARAALEEVAPWLIGHDARFIRGAGQIMDEALNGHAYAKAAIDIALWDLLGKAYGLRVCELLGGALRERVPSYYSLSVAEPDDVASLAVQKQEQGYKRLQLKVGGRPIEADLETIRKVAAKLRPGIRLAVDANRTWTATDAITVSRLCDDVAFVMEQPCNSFEETLSIRPYVRHPIFLDEIIDDVRTLNSAITGGIAQGFGFKITRFGGLTKFQTIRDICSAYNMPHTCDDAWGGDIIAATCVHMAATVRGRILEGVWIAAPYIEEHYDPEHPVEVVDGCIEVPRGPGLGVTPATERWEPPIARYR